MPKILYADNLPTFFEPNGKSSINDILTTLLANKKSTNSAQQLFETALYTISSLNFTHFSLMYVDMAAMEI
jgi:hypothetical protein